MQPNNSDYIFVYIVAAVLVVIVGFAIRAIGIVLQNYIKKRNPGNSILEKFTPAGLILTGELP